MSNHVLMVEDNASHAEMIADELEASLPGWAVHQAGTLAEARAKLRARAFDLLMFDFRLPDGDGIELLREVRGSGVEAPIVFVTTASSAKLAVDAMKLGADDYLVKEEGYLSVLPYLVQEVLKRRQLAREREILEDRLQRAERAASLGYLASGLAHHINNPLATIRTFLQLLPTNVDDPEFRTKYLELALAESERIRDLVKDIMRAATVPQQAHEIQRIEDIIARAEEGVAGAMQTKGIVCKLDFPADLPPVRVHGEAATCLFLTLLQNAVRFSPDGGTIDIAGHADVESGRVVVTVRDYGPGISPDDRERIFEPFFTTAVDGLGMGLFVASRIADLQDIQLALEPGERQGAAFRVGIRCADGVTTSPPGTDCGVSA
jgi:two-component system sensor histidine kinase HydH